MISERVARGFSLLRGAMLLLIAAMLLFAPERAMPGSEGEPAHALTAMLGSRTLLVGLGLVLLAARGELRGLAWVLFADAALQLFDTGLAIVGDKGALAVLPAVIGALDASAGAALLRRARPASAEARSGSPSGAV